MVVTLYNREINILDSDRNTIINYPDKYEFKQSTFGYGTVITIKGNTPINIISNNICIIDRRK